MSKDKVKSKKPRINARAKGASGERELANLLRDDFGFAGAKRGQQHAGGEDSPDVVCPNLNWHIECKRVQRLDIHGAMKQAIRDCGESSGKGAVVMHRGNGEEWLATVRLDVFMGLVLDLMKDEI